MPEPLQLTPDLRGLLKTVDFVDGPAGETLSGEDRPGSGLALQPYQVTLAQRLEAMGLVTLEARPLHRVVPLLGRFATVAYITEAGRQVFRKPRLACVDGRRVAGREAGTAADAAGDFPVIPSMPGERNAP